MDQYISTVIIAGMTGVFSLLTLFIQKRQDKAINKIDEKTMFTEKEKILRQKLMQYERDRDIIIQKVIILILDTDIDIIKTMRVRNPNTFTDTNVFQESEDLKTKFLNLSSTIVDLTKEYEMIIDMTNAFQREYENNK